MNIGFFNCHKVYNNNKMFSDPSSPIGDDLMYPFVYLGQQLKKLGHKASTLDTDSIENFDAAVFVDFPGIKNKYLGQLVKNNCKNIYLMAIESPVVKPDNMDPNNHKYFKKVFTWADDLIDNKKYFKINYSQKIPEKIDFNAGGRKTLCAMIAGNKFTAHPKELYTERTAAIRWFEKNHPNDFDLYGKGWDRYYFNGRFLGINIARLNRLKFLTKLLRPYYPSWKGEVKSKKETYKKYKFALCYENCRGANGYITEKIFDGFFAGCVPIYLGASNITRYIPENTFIDKRKFKTYGELYKYIKNMPDEEYLNYQKAIENFLKSGGAYPFSAEAFAQTLIKEITS